MEYNFLTLIDKFVEQGYMVVDNLLSENDLARMGIYFDERLSEFKSSHIGLGKHKKHDAKIRSDEILWMDEKDPELSTYYSKIEDLISVFKKELFLPIKGFETQMAKYCRGGFYAKHKDRHKDTDARLITTVFYLNKNWISSDQGQLLVYVENNVVEIEPIANRLVVFLSELEHEVLTSNRDRKSLTSWLRNDIL